MDISTIPGLDLNFKEVLQLSIKDKVMVEIEGQDCNPGKFSKEEIEEHIQIPWVVTKVTGEYITMDHALSDTKIKVKFSTILSDNPACFATRLHKTPYPIIIKLPAYNITIAEASKQKKVEMTTIKNEMKAMKSQPLSVLTNFIIDEFKSMKPSGWKPESVARFCIKTGIPLHVQRQAVDRGMSDFNVSDMLDIYESMLNYRLWRMKSMETGISEATVDGTNWQRRLN